MKTKLIKTGLTALLLLTLLTSAVTASAEENGYWTMKTDDTGMPVMIYTYTEPVQWTIDEQSGYGHCGMTDSAAISQSDQADTYLSADAHSNVQAAAVAAIQSPKSETQLTLSLLLSSLSAILGFIVFAIFLKKILHRKSPVLIKS